MQVFPYHRSQLLLRAAPHFQNLQSVRLSDAVVRRRDMDRLMVNILKYPENYQPMHVQTLNIALMMRGIDDPRGMRGRDLSVDYTLVWRYAYSLANLREAWH